MVSILTFRFDVLFRSAFRWRPLTISIFLVIEVQPVEILKKIII